MKPAAPTVLSQPTVLSHEQYAALAAFRRELRGFLSFSAAAAAAAGVPAQQHQALLAVAGHAGADPPSVGMLARDLGIAPHSAAGLAARMEAAGLLSRSVPVADRRRRELTLTPKASRLLTRLTDAHLRELASLQAALARALG